MMFGFTRRFRSDAQLQDSARPEGILISKENIYRENRGLEPILLLRKGYEITTEELPRLIKNGARPQQFQLKNSPEVMRFYENREGRTLRNPDDMPMRTNATLRPLASANVGQNKKTVMILDADQKSMKRLIDCLFICGLSLNRIHPVRMAAHLGWALKKYRPQILFVDYALSGSQNGLDVLASLPKALPGQSGFETVILTLPQNANLTDTERQLITLFCQEKKIEILEKPISRFALKRLFLSDSSI